MKYIYCIKSFTVGKVEFPAGKYSIEYSKYSHTPYIKNSEGYPFYMNRTNECDYFESVSERRQRIVDLI